MKIITLLFLLCHFPAVSQDGRQIAAHDFITFAQRYVRVDSTIDDLVSGTLSLSQKPEGDGTELLKHVLSRAVTTVSWLSHLTLTGFGDDRISYSAMFVNLKPENFQQIP